MSPFRVSGRRPDARFALLPYVAVAMLLLGPVSAMGGDQDGIIGVAGDRDNVGGVPGDSEGLGGLRIETTDDGGGMRTHPVVRGDTDSVAGISMPVWIAYFVRHILSTRV